MSKVLVPLAQGCEELEAITIVDLLRRAGIQVITVGLDDQVVTASRGTRLLPDKTIEDVLYDDFDLIVMPGGLPGADNLNENEHLHDLLKRHNLNKKYIGAICAAPKVLATAGILDNKSATAFPGVLEKINHQHITITGAAVELDGNVITSRGPGTAMDFALKLIELLEGKSKSELVAHQLVRD